MNNIDDFVNKARLYFSIDEYPGFLYELIKSTKSYFKEYGLFLFQEDIDKLSGFIGYEENYAIICINSKRNIGHQNLTLAHELGHFFMHEGVTISDGDDLDKISGAELIEKEAFLFASELLYPKKLVRKDANKYDIECLVIDRRYEELTNVINDICHKYYISFTWALQKLLYETRQLTFKDKVMQGILSHIEKISNLDKTFYQLRPNDTDSVIDDYLYKVFEETWKEVLTKGKISQSTMDAWLLDADILED